MADTGELKVERDGPNKVVTIDYGTQVKAVSMPVTTFTPIEPPYGPAQVAHAREMAVRDNDKAAGRRP